MKPWFAVAATAYALALTGMAAAQTAPVPDAQPLARTSATEVLLDVAVLDKHGKPVKNLKASDLAVYEDDVRQDVTSFRFVSATESQRNSLSAQVTAQPSVRSLRAVNLVCLVFHNLDPVTRNRAMAVAREFLANELPSDTYIGMFILDDRLTPVYPFTRNTKEVAEAVGKAFTLRPIDFAQASEAVLTANPTQVTITTAVNSATHTATTTYRVTGGEVSPTVIAGADVSNGSGANVMRGEHVTESRDLSNITGMRETDKITNMIAQFGQLPGRKLVLLLSTGFTTTGDPDLFQSILAKAVDSRITVYAIDPTGLTETSTAQAADLALGQVAGVSRTQTAASTSLSAAKEKSRQGDTLNNAVRASDLEASLRELAEGTGGFLVANTNEFHKPLQRIADDLETHYELTYRPVSATYDGRLRTIRIQPAHADWRVESRTGYFAMPALGDSSALLPQEIVGLGVLDSKPRPHAFDFRTAIFQFPSGAGNSRASLVIEIPGSALSAAPNPSAHIQVLHGQAFAVVKDSTGQIVDKFSLDAPYQIPDARMSELRSMPLVFTHSMDLPPGHYTAETALLDREGGRASTDTAAFDMASGVSGLGMSSALLIRRIEPVDASRAGSDPLIFHGKRLVPFVETSLSPDINPFAYFVVYPNLSNPAKPKVQVEFRVDGEVLANQTADLPAPDPSGTIPMVIRAAVHTGRCELKITAIQGAETATRTLTYTVPL